jgi:chromosome segregation ATPase
MNVIAEKLRQAYHNDLTDVPILLDGADEIDKLCEALERFNAETIALTKRVEELDEQSRAAFEALRAERDRLRERVVKLERSQLETSIENNRLREALSVTSADDPRYQKYWTNLGGRIAERDRLREALTGLLAIDENTEPLVAKAAWLRAEAALAKEAGK